MVYLLLKQALRSLQKKNHDVEQEEAYKASRMFVLHTTLRT